MSDDGFVRSASNDDDEKSQLVALAEEAQRFIESNTPYLDKCERCRNVVASPDWLHWRSDVEHEEVRADLGLLLTTDPLKDPKTMIEAQARVNLLLRLFRKTETRANVETRSKLKIKIDSAKKVLEDLKFLVMGEQT